MGRSLAGSRVLVLGGSSGIGLATAKAAAAGGAKVTLASRSTDKVNAAVAQVGHGAAGAALDTTSDAALEAFFSKQPEWDHIVVSVDAGRIADARLWLSQPAPEQGRAAPGLHQRGGRKPGPWTRARAVAGPREHDFARADRHADSGRDARGPEEGDAGARGRD